MFKLSAKKQYLDHTAPLFEQLRILPLDKVIIHAKATFMHQSFHYFLAMHIYTFQKDVLLEAYFREEDENGKLYTTEWKGQLNQAWLVYGSGVLR